MEKVGELEDRVAMAVQVDGRPSDLETSAERVEARAGARGRTAPEEEGR